MNILTINVSYLSTVLLFVIILWLIIKFFLTGTKSLPLIKSDITVLPDNSYQVALLEKQERIQDREYIKLLLLTVCSLLHSMDKKQGLTEHEALASYISQLTKTDPENISSMINSIMEQRNIVIAPASSNKIDKKCTLQMQSYFGGLITRSLSIKLPTGMSNKQIVDSEIALLSNIINKLSQDVKNVHILQTSLEIINRFLQSNGVTLNSRDNRILPNIAYNDGLTQLKKVFL